jgi:uncharacterized protein (DUF2336 family)
MSTLQDLLEVVAFPETPEDRDSAEQAIRAMLDNAKAEGRREAALDLMRVDEAPSRMPGIRFAVGFLGGIKK